MTHVMRKPDFCTADQHLCSPHRYVEPLYFLNPKFQASSDLLWLHTLVCVRPGRTPEDSFSHDMAHRLLLLFIRIISASEMILMRTHNNCFYGEILKMFPYKLSPISLLIRPTVNVEASVKSETQSKPYVLTISHWKIGNSQLS